MKTLEQLGISPAPWFANVYGEVSCHYVRTSQKRERVVAKTNFHFDEHIADARLIAAAPKLYEAVYDLLEIVGNVSEYIEVDCDTMAKVERARDALAEAAGEEASDGTR